MSMVGAGLALLGVWIFLAVSEATDRWLFIAAKQRGESPTNTTNWLEVLVILATLVATALLVYKGVIAPA